MQLICVIVIHAMIRLGSVGENLTTTGTTRDMNAVVMRDLKIVKMAKRV